MSTACRILYCHCAYARVVPPQVKADVLAALTNAQVGFDAVPDLCEMSARRDPRLKELAAWAGGAEGSAPAATTPLTIVACYPRAVRWLFSAADAALPQEGVTILNMRTESAETVTKALLEPASPATGEPATAAAGPETAVAAAAEAREGDV